MKDLHIKNPFALVDPKEIQSLHCFCQKKDAVKWCKDNNVKPAKIQKLKTKFQETYALNMGHNCFLIDVEMFDAIKRLKDK